MERITEACNMKVAGAIADMYLNGVDGEFVHQLAQGKFHKKDKLQYRI